MDQSVQIKIRDLMDQAGPLWPESQGDVYNEHSHKVTPDSYEMVVK